MIVGSTHFLKVFQREIITPFIFQRKSDFIQAMHNEIGARHSYSANSDRLDIKEGPGGLRDFENFVFIIKAHFEWSEPLTDELYSRIQQSVPKVATQFDALVDDYHLLKHIRDLYRLIVSNEDHLEGIYLDQLVRPFCLAHGLEIESGAELAELINQIMRQNVERIVALFEIFGLAEIPTLTGQQFFPF